MVKEARLVVALFGGSFDPPHLGHQKIVQAVANRPEIDKVLVVPTYLNPFKETSCADAKQRLAWCHTLFDPIPKVSVEAYEVSQGRRVTTWESLSHFKQYYDVRYLVIGADNVATLEQWHQFEAINQEITWLIATRAGYPLHTDALKRWQPITIDLPISSTQIRESGSLEYIDPRIKQSVQKILQTKPKGYPSMTIEERIDQIVTLLDEKKAEEIEVFNLEGADYIADRVVIANSLNLKHTQALYDHLKDVLKPQGESFLHADMSDEWIVADLGDILIHIMIPEYRQRYSLESFLSELVEHQQKEK